MKKIIPGLLLASLLSACSTEETKPNKGMLLNENPNHTSSKSEVLTCHSFTLYFFGFGET